MSAGARLRPARTCAVLLAAAVLLAGCVVEREVLSVDEAQHREVALLVGTPAPDEPPAPAFAAFTRDQAAASLGRVIVRPSTWITFIREDPEPLLSPEQIAWAAGPVAEHVPRLKPDERVQLRFRDRFHNYRVEVEVYPEGRFLVYRFTRLADQPERVAEQPNVNKVRYARLEPQPGQIEDSERDVEILRDPIFTESGASAPLARRQALLDAAAGRGVSAETLAPARALLAAHPDLPLEALRSYVEKLEVVLEGRAKGLFSPEEAAARQQALLDELTRSAEGAAKP